jgi:hypothetical protein
MLTLKLCKLSSMQFCPNWRNTAVTIQRTHTAQWREECKGNDRTHGVMLSVPVIRWPPLPPPPPNTPSHGGGKSHGARKKNNKEDHAFCCRGTGSTRNPILGNTGKASTCHTERRILKRGREIAIVILVNDAVRRCNRREEGGAGEGGGMRDEGREMREG